MGPTLILVYIDCLYDLQLQNCKIFSYDAGTALINTGVNWDETYRSAQVGINVVREWLNGNLFTLNVEKTKVVRFSIRNHTLPQNLHITLR